MFEMMRQAQALQSKMKAFQDEMEKSDFVGTAGGGAVTVTVNGKHEVKKVSITPEAAASGSDMLQDLVKAAVNEASRKANDHLKEGMGRISGGLSLPGLF
jgi:hypothetical protein